MTILGSTIRATLVCALAVSNALAQNVAGHVTRGGTPVNGAVLSLIDDKGKEAARTIVGNGEFSIKAPSPGRFAVRVLQIGWMPTRVGPYDLTAGQARRVDIELTSSRVALEAMVITDKSNCGPSSDSTSTAYLVWEEARKAFLAASLTRGEPFRMTVSRHTVVFDASGQRVVADSSSTAEIPSVNPFVSLPVQTLASAGYITSDQTGARTYWGPDADVLLSDPFVSTHCFRSRRSANADSAQLVGVAFTPSLARDRVAEISGVVWVDRSTNELRSLDYEYVNAPPLVQGAHPGGHIVFLHAPGGRWIVSHWTIRYPITATGVKPADVSVVPGVARSSRDEKTEKLVGIRTESADVSRISRGGEAVWESGKVSAAFRVIDSTTHVLVRGVFIRFAGDASARGSDSMGVVRFDRLSPGAALLHLDADWLAAIGKAPLRARVEVPTSNDAVIDVAVPSTRIAVREQCGASVLDWGEGLVRIASSQPITDPVRLVWRQAYQVLGSSDSVVVERTRDAVRDGAQYIVCGVPRGASVQVLRGAQPVTTAVMPTGSSALLVTVPPQ